MFTLIREYCNNRSNYYIKITFTNILIIICKLTKFFVNKILSENLCYKIYSKALDFSLL